MESHNPIAEKEKILQADNQALRARLTDLEKSHLALKHSNSSLNIQNTGLEWETATLRRSNASLEVNNTTLKQLNTYVQSQIDALEGETQRRVAELEDETRTLKERNLALEDLIKDRAIKLSEDQLRDELVATKATLEAEKEALQKQVVSLKKCNVELEADCSYLRRKVEGLQCNLVDHNALKESNTKLQERNDTLEESNTILEEDKKKPQLGVSILKDPRRYLEETKHTLIEHITTLEKHATTLEVKYHDQYCEILKVKENNDTLVKDHLRYLIERITKS